jgi:hypothetical protein
VSKSKKSRQRSKKEKSRGRPSGGKVRFGSVLQGILENLEPNFRFGRENYSNLNLNLQVQVQEGSSVQVRRGLNREPNFIIDIKNFQIIFGPKV